MTAEEARRHIGAGVVYRPPLGTGIHEAGEIIWVSDGGHVFVLYVGDRTPKATRAEDLQLLSGAFADPDGPP